jgi:hypothetical protein
MDCAMNRRAKDPEISLEELRDMLNYDPETGIFVKRRSYSTRWHAGRQYGPALPGEYLKITIGNRRIKAHRIAWFFVHGEWPKCDIDHINGDIHDNRIANLRDVTMGQNPLNRGDNKNNTSGVKGVSLERYRNKPPLWKAFISLGGRKINLGRRKDFSKAVALRKAAEKKYFGEFARAA